MLKKRRASPWNTAALGSATDVKEKEGQRSPGGTASTVGAGDTFALGGANDEKSLGRGANDERSRLGGTV
jgi:endonuclease YncB( thermonuclease family)